jgi:N-acetylglucosaminyldiphosphoundecaprenol N-acetyl-beta-D-mannosaminyltransferase
MHERIHIMNVPFDTLNKDQIIDLILEKLKGNTPFFIATPNPEMLLEARKNPEFLYLLNHTDLNIPDGTGIIWASKYIYKKKVIHQRITGTDIMQEICANAPTGTNIFLLGAREGIASLVKYKLEQKYPIKIVGTSSESASSDNDEKLQKLIKDAEPEILFVAFGAPKQEFWLQRNLPHLRSVKIAMGVGGAFDFIAGKRKRAPKLMQKLGLEWLFRLIQQPSRIKRIFNATIKFPLLILFSRK